jgi:DNA-binding SARP family transcriptional activator
LFAIYRMNGDFVEFRLLGPMEVLRDGIPVELRGHKARSLLAILLLHANQTVTVEMLVDALWGDEVPASARQSVHYCVHRVRQALGGSPAADRMLATEPGGYRARVVDGALDIARFEDALRAARQARVAGTLADAAEVLDQALALWRGPALADFATEPFAQPHIARLAEERLLALEERGDTWLALGRHAELADELQVLTRAHPFRERLWAQLMVALYRSGRQVEALAAYQTLRRTLNDELGVEPGAELRRLEQQLLRQALAPPQPQPPSARTGGVDPAVAAPARPSPSREPEPSAAAPRPGVQPSPGVTPRQGMHERRVATIMVVGAADRTAAMADPEDALDHRARVLRPIFATVHRFGGRILSAVGGTVIAVFGVPRAREDDPERAVRAALAACLVVPPDAGDVRVGVDTGETVVVSRFGDDAGPGPGEVAVAGDISGRVLDTAMDLYATAPAGGVLVGQAAWRATRQRIEYEPAGLGWRAVAPRSRTGATVDDPDHGARAPLTEREYDLALLAGMLDRVRRDRTPQLVTLIGAPGIGKTRLVVELARQAERDPELITWRQGRSLPYGEREAGHHDPADGDLVALLALTEVVRAHAGILDSDGPEVAQAKLESIVTDLFPVPDTAARITEHLLRLLHLGAAGKSSTSPREAFAAWIEFLEAVADDRPLVLVFEDLHWADATLLDFIDELVARAGPVPLLVVCTSRPELLARQPGWGGGKANAISVSIGPLSPSGTRTLLDALLDAEGIPLLDETARGNLLAKAGGNPLFLEEYVRVLRDQPDASGDLPLPETLQQLITARIDLLGDDRRLLQDLAVLGEPGWTEPLAALSGAPAEEVEAALDRLERQELLRRARVPGIGDQRACVFRHPLIREVAYQQLIRAERAAKHRLVAAWLERRPAPPVDLLAHHYSLALALDEADGRQTEDLHDRARQAFRAAGDRMMALDATHAAAKHYQAALALWPRDDPARPELLFSLGRALLWGQHAGRAELTEARDAFAAAGDHGRAAEADSELGILAAARGDASASTQHFRRASSRAALTAETMHAYLSPAIDLMLSDRPVEAIKAARQCHDLAVKLGVVEVEGGALSLIAHCKLQLGNPTGIEDFRRSMAIFAKTRLQTSTRRTRWLFVWNLWWAGELGRCAEAFAEHDLDIPPDDTGTRKWTDAVNAGLDYAAGRWDQVVALVDRASSQPDDEQTFVLPWCHTLRGRVRLGRGDLDGALADALTAQELAANIAGRRQAHASAALQCRALLAAGDRAQAAACVDALLPRLAEVPDGSAATPDLALTLADLGRPPGALPNGLAPTRWHEAVRALADGDPGRSAELYDALGSPADAADARLRAAQRQLEAGAETAARAVLAPALAFWRAAGADRHLRAAEALLAGIPRRVQKLGRGR